MRKILFVCVHNAGRSQMAEALTNRLARDRGLAVMAASAGTTPDDKILWQAQVVMTELGIPTLGLTPKVVTQDMVNAADQVITMGCGADDESCAVRLGAMADWGIPDPKGLGRDQVRAIRDQIRARVEALLDEVQRDRNAGSHRPQP